MTDIVGLKDDSEEFVNCFQSFIDNESWQNDYTSN